MKHIIEKKFGSKEAWIEAVALCEGAMSYAGLYWIDPSGKSFVVNDLHAKTTLSHEEYAEKYFKKTLEKVLRLGYIRIQAIQPQYLFIDHRQKQVKRSQQASLTSFFFNPDMSQKEYAKILIERDNYESRDFGKGNNSTALEYAISGEVEAGSEEEESVISNGDFSNLLARRNSHESVLPSFEEWMKRKL